MTAESAAAAAPTRRNAALDVLGVLLVAACLRTSITAVGPLMAQLDDAFRLGEAAFGFLGAIPLLMFGLVSPFVHRLSERLGVDTALALALAVLTGGILLRSYGAAPGLWAGAVVIGASVAVANVLTPAVVRRDHPTGITWVTSLYSAVMGAAAATAAALAVPVSLLGDWRLALAMWCPLTLLVAVSTARSGVRRRARSVTAEPEGVKLPSVWRQATAWIVTLLMSVQSIIFFTLITWLPTIESTLGVTPAEAGAHLFLFLGAGVVFGLLTPRLIRGADLTLAALVTSIPLVIALIGLLVAPSLVLLWIAVGGMNGGVLVVALSLISIRARSHREAVLLSGMSQSVGYLLAAAGPFSAGLLAQISGGWTATLVTLCVLAVVQVIVACLAGRAPRAP